MEKTAYLLPYLHSKINKIHYYLIDYQLIVYIFFHYKMNNSKAFILLKTFDTKELKEFKKYLNRNFNAENLICKIFHYYLQKKEVAITQPRIFSLPKVYQKIYNKPLDGKGRKVFLNALHNLNKALKQFLLRKELEKDSFEKDQLLIKIFQERKLAKLVKQTIHQRKEKIQVSTIKNQWHPLRLLQLTHHAYFENYEEYFVNRKASMQEMMTYLDQFYSTLKMYYTCETENRSKLMPESYHIHFKTEIIEYAKATRTNSVNLVYYYYLCYDLARNNQIKQYVQLKDYLATHEDNLSLEDQQFSCALMINFLIRQYRSGQKEYMHTLFIIHKKGIERKLFFYNGQLLSNTFHNIITIACGSREYKWAKKFVEQYQKYLPIAAKKATVHLGKAIIYFAEGQFKKVLSELNKVIFEDISFELRAKALTLRSFYELKENEELILHYCASFQKFLKGNRYIQPAISNSYLVLIKYIKLFLKQPNKLTNKEITVSIKAEKALQFQEWLLAKANQLP